MTTKRFASFVIALSMVLGVGCGSDGDGVSSLVQGEFELFYDLDLDNIICENGQWMADVTLKCTLCGPGISDIVTPTGVRVFLWQYSQDVWTKLETLSLSLDTQSPHAIDLTALGATCDDVDTAVVLVPTGPSTYGSPEFEGLNRGAGNGGGMFGKESEPKTADYTVYCDPNAAVRAEAVLYNYVTMKKRTTISLSPPTGDDGGGAWTGVGPSKEAWVEMLLLVGYDAEDVIQCSTFL